MTKKNLLAQDYVKEYKYPWTRQTPGCLEWDHRKSLIVNRLLDVETKADIVCLQEAQIDLFAELLTSLSPIYDGVVQNVTRGHNVGMCFMNIINVILHDKDRALTRLFIHIWDLWMTIPRDCYVDTKVM